MIVRNRHIRGRAGVLYQIGYPLKKSDIKVKETKDVAQDGEPSANTIYQSYHEPSSTASE